MTTTDTDALEEQIDDAIRAIEDGAGYEVLLGIIAAEVRKAKAEALREAADDPALRLSGHSGISITRLRGRATEYETRRQR